MSYGSASALQEAVYQHLVADTALATLVGGAIYDTVPVGNVPTLYVSLGPEDVTDRSGQTGNGALHEFAVSVVTDVSGFQLAKDVAGAITDALVDAPLALSRGSLVSLNFFKARARRVRQGATRRIDIIFRARIDGTGS